MPGRFPQSMQLPDPMIYMSRMAQLDTPELRSLKTLLSSGIADDHEVLNRIAAEERSILCRISKKRRAYDLVREDQASAKCHLASSFRVENRIISNKNDVEI